MAKVSSVNLEHYPERSAELQFGSWTPGPSSAIQQASPPVAQPFGYDIGGNQNVGTYGDQLRLQHGRSGGPSSQMPSYSNRAYSTRTHGLTANRASTERPAQSPYVRHITPRFESARLTNNSLLLIRAVAPRQATLLSPIKLL